MEKNVVFVIDVSGSMFGTKLQQVTRSLFSASENHNYLPFRFYKRLVLFVFVFSFNAAPFPQRSFHILTQVVLSLASVQLKATLNV